MKQIDPKYGIKVVSQEKRAGPVAIIVQNFTGVEIPEDEPLILFRARDRHALRMLCYYRTLCAADACTEFHLAGIDDRIKAFSDFAAQHPDRMKQPGIIRGQ